MFCSVDLVSLQLVFDMKKELHEIAQCIPWIKDKIDDKPKTGRCGRSCDHSSDIILVQPTEPKFGQCSNLLTQFTTTDNSTLSKRK